jgi:hypothetical protein
MSKPCTLLAAAGLALLVGLTGADRPSILPAAALAAPPTTSSAEQWKEARWAIEYNQFDVIARLLTAGLPINARNPEGWTLLHVAAWKGDLKMVRYLIDQGADPSARNSKGETPGQVTFDAQVRSMLAGSSKAPGPPPPYCIRMYHEATRLCDTGSAGSFCRTQAANKAQACNRTGVW